MSARELLRAVGTPVRSLGRRLLGSVVRVETDRRVMALTFDDGPDPAYTPRLLDILGRHGARGTFFLIGQRAERHPELVEELAARGHVVGNHGWDHASFPTLSAGARRDQLRRTARVLGRHASGLFRPPYCHQTLASRLDALVTGHDVIVFDRQIEDWIPQSAERLTERLLSRVRPGGIVVLHDSIWESDSRAADRGPLLEALDAFLARSAGDVRFVTVPELMRIGRPVRKNWVVPDAAAYVDA